MIRALAVLLLALAIVPARAQRLERPDITIAIAGASNFAAAYFAAEHGMFAAHGLHARIVMINEGSTAIAGLMSDSFQVAGPTSTVFLQAIDNGLDLVVAAPAYAFPTPSHVGILAAPSAHITGPADMVGKRVGTPGVGGILDILARAWLIKAGIDPARVTTVELAFPLMADALRSGQVDAVIANEPIYPRLIEQHLAVPVLDMRTMLTPGTIGGEYATTRAFAVHNPETLAALRGALADAVAAIAEDPAAGKATMARVLKLPPEVASLLTMPNLTTRAGPDSLNDWVRIMRAQHLLTHEVDARATIYP